MQIIESKKEEYQKYVEVNSQDDYSKCCMDAGEVFGNALDAGSTPDEANAEMCKSEAGQGLTGFMASMIFQAIARFHPRGEEVRVWWNRQCGVEVDEGIANAAVLNVSDDGTMSPEIEKI